MEFRVKMKKILYGEIAPLFGANGVGTDVLKISARINVISWINPSWLRIDPDQ